ncbi:LuxR family transcriptional regulator [Tsuneonella flava]|uniref:LuxR family transcriptional regulator n=1 Tax=Tsuneonella flava TaxID=2055955 RepID=A0ABX7KAE7_9SPHN|nr:LuxR family transcriptional regulator [Tsuneonella flava]QSB44974.1 LuxR family transcriptional regulator [Tsuneonella flava]
MASGDETGFWPWVEAIDRAETISGLRDTLLAAFSYVGFTAAYFLGPVVSDARVGRVLTNVGFPREWEERYRAEFYLIDPIATHAITRRGAFCWPDDLAGTPLKPAERDYLALLADYGMERGVGLASFGPFARTGFIGVGLPRSGIAIDRRSILMVEVAARLAHQRYLRLIDPFPNGPPSLSDREIEVLSLIAQGKSNAVIAQLLDISPSSVDVYVKRIFTKMGVADRTSASVRALAMGLVITGRFPKQPHSGRL